MMSEESGARKLGRATGFKQGGCTIEQKSRRHLRANGI